MKRHYIAMFLFVFATIFVASSSTLLAASPACVAVQVDNHLFTTGMPVAVYGISRGETCPVINGLESPIWLTLSRWAPSEDPDANDPWVRVADVSSAVTLGEQKRKLLQTFENLPEGQYILNVVNGNAPGPWNWVEALAFVVGGTSSEPLPAPNGTPFIRSARIVLNGELFFRGHIGNGSRFAQGYVYQLGFDKTELLPVTFEQLDPQAVGETLNQGFLRGGTLDLSWVKAVLPNNTLRGDRPVYGSIRSDGGWPTVQGVVFDPTDPSATVAGFNASR